VVATHQSEDGFKLGNWVRKQRRNRKSLHSKKIQRLESLHFVWDPHEAKWEIGFALLEKYKQEFGDCLVPNEYKTACDYALGNWVGTQRGNRKSLSLKRIKRLNAIGFVWSLKK
jgi:hypothetical protein